MAEPAVIDRSLQPREYALVPIAVALGMLLVYDMPFFGLPMAALVLGRLIYAGRPGLAFVAVALAAAGSVAYGVVRPVMVLPSMAALIWGARAIVAWRPWQVIAVITLVATVSYGASLFIQADLADLTVGEGAVQGVDLVLDAMDANYDSAQVDPATRTVYRDIRGTVRTGLLQVLPGLLLVSMLIGGGLATSALARLSAAHGTPIPGHKPLTSFALPMYAVLVLALGLGLTAWVLYTDAEGTVLGAIALNTLVVSAAAVTLQGFAVVDSMMRRFRMGPILRLIGYVVLIVTGTLGALLAIMGVADFWLDTRKLRRGDTPGDDTGAAFPEAHDGPSEDAADGGVE